MSTLPSDSNPNAINKLREFEFVLPWPISINAYYSRRSWTSEKGRIWRDDAIECIWSQLGGKRPEPLSGPVSISMEVWLPDDRRKRDIDNHTGKHIWDMFTKASIWEDDSQVWEEHKYRRGKNGKGKVHIIVKEI